MLKVPSAGGNHEIPKSPNFSLNVNNQLQLKSVPIVLVIGRPPRWRQTLSTDGFYLLGLSIQGIQCDFQELGIPFLMLLLKKIKSFITVWCVGKPWLFLCFIQM